MCVCVRTSERTGYDETLISRGGNIGPMIFEARVLYEAVSLVRDVCVRAPSIEREREREKRHDALNGGVCEGAARARVYVSAPPHTFARCWTVVSICRTVIIDCHIPRDGATLRAFNTARGVSIVHGAYEQVRCRYA